VNRLAVVLVALCAASELQAQKKSSTIAGVYSDEQATRGRDVYLGNCKSCHTPESHTGPLFKSTWGGRPLSELYVFVRDRMPKNEPGSLSPQENADVVAYLLQLNRLPAGQIDLPADSATLKSIRIDTSMNVRKDP
jgi:mono/diheme cytochrome c family protein